MFKALRWQFGCIEILMWTENCLLAMPPIREQPHGCPNPAGAIRMRFMSVGRYGGIGDFWGHLPSDQQEVRDSVYSVFHRQPFQYVPGLSGESMAGGLARRVRIGIGLNGIAERHLRLQNKSRNPQPNVRRRV
jgi:hypothetical protein